MNVAVNMVFYEVQVLRHTVDMNVVGWAVKDNN
jgi:hypothetical protein